jgi:hypothetical protein
MAKYFIYHNAGFSGGTVTDGTVSTTTFSASSSVTNEDRANDMSIATAFTSFGANDALRFDVGSANASTNCDRAALYFTSAHGHDMKIYSADHETNMGTALVNKTDNWVEGWNELSFSDASGQYKFIQSTTGTIDDITEVIIGKKLSLTNIELTGSEGMNYGNSNAITYEGNKFSNQRHYGQRFWNFDLKLVSSTYKTSLETMREAIDGARYKFLYYDGSAYYYVRMSDDSLRFKEVAYGVYDTSIRLTEQLS